MLETALVLKTDVTSEHSLGASNASPAGRVWGVRCQRVGGGCAGDSSRCLSPGATLDVPGHMDFSLLQAQPLWPHGARPVSVSVSFLLNGSWSPDLGHGNPA